VSHQVHEDSALQFKHNRKHFTRTKQTTLCHRLNALPIGGVAQWLGRQSLAGRLCLIYALPIGGVAQWLGRQSLAGRLCLIYACDHVVGKVFAMGQSIN